METKYLNKNVRLLLCVALTLVSCTAFPSKEDHESAPITVIKTCTLLGCSSSLSLSFTGNIPDALTVEVFSNDGRKAVIYCPDTALSKELYPLIKYEIAFYSIGDAPVHDSPELAKIARVCESTAGFISETTLDDGTLIEIIVQCFEPESFELLRNSRCDGDGVTFNEFVPQEIGYSISWSEGQVSGLLRPEYEVSQPNGPDCEPTCYSFGTFIELP